MNLRRILFIALLLSWIQKGWAEGEPLIHFGRPFKDSIVLQNTSSDTTKIESILFEGMGGSESGLIFEFRVNETFYLTEVDRDQSSFISGPYKAITELAIPPKKSITLSGLNIGRLPLLCPCEDALASFPILHKFRITISGSMEKYTYILEGDVYTRPPDAIVSNQSPFKTMKSSWFKINGQGIPSPSTGKSVVGIQVKKRIRSGE